MAFSHADIFKSIQKSIQTGILAPLRRQVDAIKIQSPRMARAIAHLIPAQCPFERDVVVLGRKIAHIPPLCKLNPLYEELVMLRFRALCYLADECGDALVIKFDTRR
jgi:hypothetical protein